MADRRAFLSVSATAAVAAPFLTGGRPAAAARGGPAPQPPDRHLRAILREVDADRIEADVRRLAAFGTRHTLSDAERPGARHRRGP